MPRHRPRHKPGEGCAKCDSEREREKLKWREKHGSKPRVVRSRAARPAPITPSAYAGEPPEALPDHDLLLRRCSRCGATYVWELPAAFCLCLACVQERRRRSPRYLAWMSE